MSPGVAGARCRSPASARNGCRLGRCRGAEQPRPDVRPEAGDAGQAGVEVAEADRAHQTGQVGGERADAGGVVLAGVDGDDQDERGPGQRCEHGLRFGHQHSFVIRLGPHPAMRAGAGRWISSAGGEGVDAERGDAVRGGPPQEVLGSPVVPEGGVEVSEREPADRPVGPLRPAARQRRRPATTARRRPAGRRRSAAASGRRRRTGRARTGRRPRPDPGSRPPPDPPAFATGERQVSAFSPAAESRYAGAIDAASARTRSTTAAPAASGVSGSPSCRR